MYQGFRKKKTEETEKAKKAKKGKKAKRKRNLPSRRDYVSYFDTTYNLSY